MEPIDILYEQWASVDQAARILGIGEVGVEILCEAGEMPGAVRLGRTWILFRAALDREKVARLVSGGKFSRLCETDEDIFLSRVQRAGDDECWLWCGTLRLTSKNMPYPYGYVQWKGRDTPAHRVAYELFVKPVPQGYHVHHECHNQRCVNPKHLRAVTPSENRRLTRWAAQPTCQNGHDMTGANAIINNRGRYCSTCKSQAGSYDRKKSKRAKSDDQAGR